MATKDWKKEKTRRGLNTWKTDAGIYIYITKVKTLKSGIMYGVDSNNPNFYHNMQFFRTKSQALKFAKDYMRSH